MADNFNYVQGVDYKLAGSGIGLSDTSITLQSFALPDGTLITMTDFGDIGYAVIAPGTSKEENISFTGITQNVNGTATLTGATRGLKFVAPYDADTGLRQSHAGGTILRISNTAPFYNELTGKDNDETITGTWTFTNPNYPQMDTATPFPTLNNQLCTKGYADSLTFAGAPDASTTQKGIVEMATQTEALDGTQTGSTGAFLVIDPDTMIKVRQTHATKDYQYGEAITAGDVLYLDTADSKWKKADASASATSDDTYGIAYENGVLNDFKIVQLIGSVVTTVSGLTTAGIQYVSDTAGQVSNSPGTYKKVVGFSPDGSTMIFYPFLRQTDLAGFIDFGGDGSDGALNVASGTTTINLGQVYNYSSINVSAGATLAFTGTDDGAYLNCSGNCTIAGTIELRNHIVTSIVKKQTTRGDTLVSGTPSTPLTITGAGGGGGSSVVGGDGGDGGTSTVASGSPGNGGVGGTAPAGNGGNGEGGNSVGGGGGGGGGAGTGAGAANGVAGGNNSGNNGGNGGDGGGNGTNGSAGAGGGGGGGYDTGTGGIGGNGANCTSGAGNQSGGGGGDGGESGANGGNGGAAGNGGSSGGGTNNVPGDGGDGQDGYTTGGFGGSGGQSQIATAIGGSPGAAGNSYFGTGGRGGTGGTAVSGGSPGARGANGANGGVGRNGGRGGDGGFAQSNFNVLGGDGGNGGDGSAGSSFIVMYIAGTLNLGAASIVNAQGGDGGRGGDGGNATGTGGAPATAGDGGNGGDGGDAADVLMLSLGTVTDSGITVNNSGGNGGIKGAGGTASSSGTANDGVDGNDGEDGRDGNLLITQLVNMGS